MELRNELQERKGRGKKKFKRKQEVVSYNLLLTHILQPADLITLSLELQLSDNIWQMMFVSPVTQHLLASQCHLGDWDVTRITHFTLPGSITLVQFFNNGCVTDVNLFESELSENTWQFCSRLTHDSSNLS